MEPNNRNTRRWSYISHIDACELSISHRMAWSHAVVERIIGLYSPHFQIKYLQRDALNMAREFAVSGSVDNDSRRDLIQRIEAAIDDAELEGYKASHLAPSVHLLIEIECKDGKGCANAVDYASLAYASHILFRQGVRGIGIPIEYKDKLADEGYFFAWNMFQFAKANSSAEVKTIDYSSVSLDTTFDPLPQSVVMRANYSPPHAEVENMSTLYPSD